MSKIHSILCADEDGNQFLVPKAQFIAEMSGDEVGPILEGTEPVAGSAPILEAPVPMQVVGYPRDLLGYRKGPDTPPQGNSIFAGTGINQLIEVIKTDPDTVVFRGANLDFELLPGKKRPTGPNSGWYGTREPEGTTTPHGYIRKEFEDKIPYYVKLL